MIRTALFLFGMMTLGMTVGQRMAQAAPPDPKFYVAVNGNDKWTGHLAAPNASHTDGPFATVQRAQQAVRAQREKGDMKPLRTRPTFSATLFAL